MTTASGRIRFYCVVIVFCLLASTTVPAKPAGGANSSAQTLALIRTMSARLEAIRSYMGKPQSEIPELNIEDARAQETYFQAVNLYAKADRLALEISRTTRDLELAGRDAGADIDDIHTIAAATLQRIDQVVKELGIEPPPLAETADAATVSDIYEAMLRAGQQVNHLLENQFSPSDVYQQVTTALHITLALFDRFPGERRIVHEPEWLPNKQPGDVYQVLLECYETVRRIAQLSDIKILRLSATPKESPYLPGEVYDLATLLVAELNYIHASVTGLSKPAGGYFPGRKYPSDVHQRARQLRMTLDKLATLIERRPDWRYAESLP